MSVGWNCFATRPTDFGPSWNGHPTAGAATGRRSCTASGVAYLDGVHGLVATALPVIGGRDLLTAETRAAWEQCIANTVQRTASREGPLVNWRPQLSAAADPKMLMQYCHGAPGFVICLSDFPGTALDELLLAAG
jgi:hypothetical protein